MDISSMMTAVQHQAAKRVASGLVASHGNGLSTSATTITASGRNVLAAAKAAATGSTASAGASSTAATTAPTSSDITSNDFLTLLVTEMQNQDPTQPTDPNAYIQQLVGVNSLQQLISINSELGNVTGGTGTTPVAVAPPVVTGGVTG